MRSPRRKLWREKYLIDKAKPIGLIPQDARDQIVNFVRRWSEKTELFEVEQQALEEEPPLSY
jgi:hypothetical protein